MTVVDELSGRLAAIAAVTQEPAGEAAIRDAEHILPTEQLRRLLDARVDALRVPVEFGGAGAVLADSGPVTTCRHRDCGIEVRLRFACAPGHDLRRGVRGDHRRARPSSRALDTLPHRGPEYRRPADR
jgi:hypothetical protein